MERIPNGRYTKESREEAVKMAQEQAKQQRQKQEQQRKEELREFW
jgi:ribosome recycling factor